MSRISTGIEGLDRVLHGGLLEQGAYLIRGGPGMGKTTLGLHFLSAAPDRVSALFIGFQESVDQLRANADTIGIDVNDIHFLNLTPDENFFTQQEQYDVFSSIEVEQGPISESIVRMVEQHRPRRVFVDSLTQLRFLTSDVFQYRKEVLSFLKFLSERKATVLFTSEHSESTPDDDLQFLADGVISLSRTDMGQEICVEKFRGSGFTPGSHQMRNGPRGVDVFPRPVPPTEELTPGRFTRVSTGIPSLDRVLDGGLDMGTITMISGPSGIGKSTLSSCIAAETAAELGHTSVYLFEEEPSSYLHRANELGIPLEESVSRGQLNLEQIEPMRYLADEFAGKVYDDVMQHNTRLVVFDSTAGFELTLMEESIKNRLHALAKSLSRINVSVILINEVMERYSTSAGSEKGISYLSDTVLTMNYDDQGNGEPIIRVIKKRLSRFDRQPYYFQIGPEKVSLGQCAAE